mgnify:CR=1 FL=1
MAQNNVRTGQPEDFMRIQDLFYLCLSKWYWFVISLGITLSVAILYVLVTPPVLYAVGGFVDQGRVEGAISFRRGGRLFFRSGAFSRRTPM